MKRASFIAASAALSVLPRIATAQNHPAMRIATIANDSLIEPFYARDSGRFTKAGLDVTVETMNNGAAVTAAVVSGAIDIGGSNVTSLIAAYSRGLPITIVAPASVYSADQYILAVLVSKTSSIKSAHDLEGKVVATSPLGGIGQFATDLWMEQNGADSSKLNWIEIPFDSMQSSLEQGRVAAVVSAEPFISKARGTCRILTKPYGAISSSFVTSAYFSSTAYVTANPELVKRFASTIKETAQWANKNPKKSGELLAKYTGLDQATIDTMGRVKYGDELRPAQIQPLIDLSLKFKQIKDGFPATSIIYQSK